MSDRAELIDGFIARSKWSDWKRAPLAGDASSRRYERLRQGDQSVVLMDAPPDGGNGTLRFAQIVEVLEGCNLCPPAVLAHDPDDGIMVLADLGPDDFAGWLANHADETSVLYSAAVDVLVSLNDVTPPTFLKHMTPQVGADMIGIAAEFYGAADGADLMQEMEGALKAHAPVADVMALRDFHAENLIWRPTENGLARVGLLDFQDAFVAPAGYDLISLLRDARRDVPPDVADGMIDRFIRMTGTGSRAQFACLGVQRNLRILGVFARLACEMGKTRYVDLIPRVWANLLLDLDHPVLDQLKQAVFDTLPEPDPALLERLRA